MDHHHRDSFNATSAEEAANEYDIEATSETEAEAAAAAAAELDDNDLTDLSVDMSEGADDPSGMKSQATLAEVSHATLPEVGEMVQDKVKLLLCCCLVLVHSIALVVLDIMMMRRRCSTMLGGSFAVFAASLCVAVATCLLAFVSVFGRRAVICVCCVWVANLVMDACWICLTFPLLDIANCLGTAMIGVTAVGLVSCPATLVAFVIMHGWYKTKHTN